MSFSCVSLFQSFLCNKQGGFLIPLSSKFLPHVLLLLCSPGVVDVPYLVLEPTHNKQDFADGKVEGKP